MKFHYNSFLIFGLLLNLGCGAKKPEPVVPKAAAPRIVEKEPEAALPKIKFVDVTAESGVSFIHENGFQGEKLLPETMGSGVAVIDFDNEKNRILLSTKIFRNALDDVLSFTKCKYLVENNRNTHLKIEHVHASFLK